jgi:hypothetical protein
VVTVSVAAMRTLKLLLTVCCGGPLSWTWITMAVPLVVAVGVPLITPPGLSVRPAGSAPDFTLQVRVPLAPAAASVSEYGRLTTPSFRAVVVIVKGVTIRILRARKAVCSRSVLCFC